MAYTVKQLSKLAGISVRTLHFYDEAGLLKPSFIERNGYRYYEEKELLKLQQILFFRELDFALTDIKKIINSKDFNILEALQSHKKFIELKQKRFNKLLETVNKTITKMQNKKQMKDAELYDSFADPEMKQYQAEAKQRWGNTEAYKQSQERTKNWTKADYEKIKADGDKFMKVVASHVNDDIKSPEVQALVAQWRQGINVFYDTDLEICRNLASMYIDDPRFAAYYEKYAKGLSVFMRDAIHYYCDEQKKLGKK